MNLGAFSISLNVKNLIKSKEFYEKLGCQIVGGNEEMKYLIMENGDSVIGLFEGMFEKNILTFNPGWDQESNLVNSYTDIRDIQKEFKKQGLDTGQDIKTSAGPASFSLKDPDGNNILIDQHI